MTSALIIIDVQKGMFLDEAPVYKGENLISTLQTLLKKARKAGITVLYIQHNAPAGKPLEYGTEAWEIHDDIKPYPGDLVIQKTTPDSFYYTTLEGELNNHGIDHLYIAGIQTEMCVDTTCRSAFGKGYKVTLISDAHSTWDSGELTAQQILNHHNGVLRWFADVYPSSEIKFEAVEPAPDRRG
ncbi:cysteine hydrolase family protein [[Bacillus] enclensis]|uniref:cysteine hydrolase family protein n=1 Tax=[Bacillus] enclensis TaxID=1402860 RepID=UPI0018DC03C0|nr:cysteine hydrolase family protein [[Bacillus] enclensis]MBH9964922.1 cysteine hydrolase [[Bacillus] enclensis]